MSAETKHESEQRPSGFTLATTDREQLVAEVIATGKRWWPSVRSKANHARMSTPELKLWQAIRAVMEHDGDAVSDRPVDHAIATEACTKCGTAIGVPCKVEIQGREHDGAHHERLAAAHPRKT